MNENFESAGGWRGWGEHSTELISSSPGSVFCFVGISVAPIQIQIQTYTLLYVNVLIKTEIRIRLHPYLFPACPS